VKPSSPGVCWHEAGHAAVAYVCGGWVQYVSALPDSDRCRWRGVCSWKQGDSEPPVADIMVAFAGPLVERRYRDLTPTASVRPRVADRSASARPASWRDGATIAAKLDLYDVDPGDARMVTDGVRILAESSPIAAGLIEERLRRRTLKLIRSRRVTHLVEALAAALYESGELSGEAATSILRRADQQLVEWQHSMTSSRAAWGEEDDPPLPVATPGTLAEPDTGFFGHASANPGPGYLQKKAGKKGLVEPNSCVSVVTTPC